MFKKKPFLIIFEGVEGSGKSYQSKKLVNSLRKKKLSVVLTREPGGTKGAERIRKLILQDYFHKNTKDQFDKYTDTLLYLAARNEHVLKKIKPAMLQKKIIVCDRFIDSTFAYQTGGKGVEKVFIQNIHKKILYKIKPNLTFVLKVSSKKSQKRLNKRKNKNRYDKFSKSFYSNAQNYFIKIANKNTKTHYVFDNSDENNQVQKQILKIVLKKINF